MLARPSCLLWLPIVSSFEDLQASLSYLSVEACDNMHGTLGCTSQVGSKRLTHTIKGCCCILIRLFVILLGDAAIPELPWMLCIRTHTRAKGHIPQKLTLRNSSPTLTQHPASFLRMRPSAVLVCMHSFLAFTKNSPCWLLLTVFLSSSPSLGPISAENITKKHRQHRQKEEWQNDAIGHYY